MRREIDWCDQMSGHKWEKSMRKQQDGNCVRSRNLISVPLFLLVDIVHITVRVILDWVFFIMIITVGTNLARRTMIFRIGFPTSLTSVLWSSSWNEEHISPFNLYSPLEMNTNEWISNHSSWSRTWILPRKTIMAPSSSSGGSCEVTARVATIWRNSPLSWNP